MAKDLEMGYLLDFYGEVLTEKQREMLRQYYNDDLSLRSALRLGTAGCSRSWKNWNSW